MVVSAHDIPPCLIVLIILIPAMSKYFQQQCYKQ